MCGKRSRASSTYASQRGFHFVELGGWAISEEIRCTSEALRMLLTVFALAQLMGGALGLSTATTRHRSSSILKRVGGRPLMARGAVVPSYIDPHYNCEMELLTFDSTSPDAHYDKWIRECRAALLDLPVIAHETPETNTLALLSLHQALSHPDQPENSAANTGSKEVSNRL